MCCHDSGTFCLLINQIPRVCVEGPRCHSRSHRHQCFGGRVDASCRSVSNLLRPLAVVERQTHLGKKQHVFLDFAEFVLKPV